MAGLYIHIPFCKQACYYCDFHFSVKQDSRQEMIQAIAHELDLQQSYLKGEQLATIYFGGGTPSLLTILEIGTIFQSIRDNFSVNEKPEVTLEANPDDLTAEKLVKLFQSGINRLSIGIQSFDDDVLRFLNRAHNAGDATRSVADARAAGFENISIDLIYAIPGQTPQTWKDNIRKAIDLQPQHISAYSLTLEPKTVFGRWQHSGKLKAVEDDFAADQFEMLIREMTSNGYEHYEISNFCKPGFRSKHNTAYWQQQKYLGVGPSAHSFDLNSRQANVSNNQMYVKAIGKGEVPFELELLTRENKINEFIFTTLRTSWGCNLQLLKNDFDFDLAGIHKVYLNDLLEKKLVSLDNHTLKLTATGKFLADKIASDLFADAAIDS